LKKTSKLFDFIGKAKILTAIGVLVSLRKWRLIMGKTRLWNMFGQKKMILGKERMLSA